MQIRCTYCQTMFPISRDEMLAALQHMDEHKQVFYDAHCPKCRRSNRVEKMKIEMLIPNWKKVIKEMEREAMAEVPEVKKAVVKSVQPEKTKTTTKKPAASTKKAAATKEKTTTAGKKVKVK
jgi:hypothetical protein